MDFLAEESQRTDDGEATLDSNKEAPKNLTQKPIDKIPRSRRKTNYFEGSDSDDCTGKFCNAD